MSWSKIKTKNKLDMNPTRIQDPKITLKRSPGTFDQRASKEQELKSLNSRRFYDRISNLQQKQTLGQLNQKILDLKSRQNNLKARCSDYSYLRKLRSALDEEKYKREALSQERKFLYNDVESVRRANIVPSVLKRSIEHLPAVTEAALITQHQDVNPDDQPAPQPVINQSNIIHSDNIQSNQLTAENNQSNRPGVKNSQSNQLNAESSQLNVLNFINNFPAPDDNQSNDLNGQNFQSNSAGNPESEDSSDNEDSLMTNLHQKKVKRTKEFITPTRAAMLESLAYEIMTRTLPIKKLKRVLPDVKPPVTQRYPIMSSHRKTNIIPLIKSQQKHLEQDMIGLKDRISNYFGEEFPLGIYKYKPNEKPRKVRILKAISHEQIKLPELPKQ